MRPLHEFLELRRSEVAALERVYLGRGLGRHVDVSDVYVANRLGISAAERLFSTSLSAVSVKDGWEYRPGD